MTWRNLPDLLYRMALLDLRAGRAGDAAAHLREALQLTLRTGTVVRETWTYCGHLCAATGRPAEAVTVWAAYAALITFEDWPGDVRNREEPLRAARQALGPEQARAAEERGAAMSRAAAAEYALLLTEDPGPRQAPGRRDWAGSAPGNGSWSPWSPRAPPTPRSPPSCTSASTRSAPTWNGSGTRPAPADAPT